MPNSNAFCPTPAQARTCRTKCVCGAKVWLIFHRWCSRIGGPGAQGVLAHNVVLMHLVWRKIPAISYLFITKFVCCQRQCTEPPFLEILTASNLKGKQNPPPMGTKTSIYVGGGGGGVTLPLTFFGELSPPKNNTIFSFLSV